MALANKKNKTIFTKVGTGNDKIESDKLTELESKFNAGEHVKDRGSFAQLGVVYLLLQDISEELDEIRRYLTNEIGNGADGIDGTNGTNGSDGQDGSDGIDGTTPTITDLNGADLPTSDRNLARGRLWNSSGTVKVKR
tara:strand:+ start:6119 stop:6532 length:414 start_codon:yes stop_codon:yes gene_type:complete